MFGDPVTNPKGWEEKPLKSVVTEIEGGWSPVCESKRATNEQWGILKLSAIAKGIYNSDENKACLSEMQPKSNLEVKSGDLLFTRKNTYNLVGACAYVKNTRPKLMFSDLVFRFITQNESIKFYLWGLFNCPQFRNKVQMLASGAAGSMPNISKTKLMRLIIPVPISELINTYENNLKILWQQQERLQKLREFSNDIFSSLISKIFNGELIFKPKEIIA